MTPINSSISVGNMTSAYLQQPGVTGSGLTTTAHNQASPNNSVSVGHMTSAYLQQPGMTESGLTTAVHNQASCILPSITDKREKPDRPGYPPGFPSDQASVDRPPIASAGNYSSISGIISRIFGAFKSLNGTQSVAYSDPDPKENPKGDCGDLFPGGPSDTAATHVIPGSGKGSLLQPAGSSTAAAAHVIPGCRTGSSNIAFGILSPWFELHLGPAEVMESIMQEQQEKQDSEMS